MINFKSILYKERYYAISFKLNYILKSNLFKIHRREYTFKRKKNIIMCYNQFVFDKLMIRKKDVIEHLFFNKLHNDNGPAVIEYYDGEIYKKQYYQNGKLHRDNGPAIIEFYGTYKCEKYYSNNKVHRINGPAIIYYGEERILSEEYCMFGKRDYEIEYFESGKSRKTYFKYNMIHRDDGPAIIEYNENGNVINTEYFRHGIHILNM